LRKRLIRRRESQNLGRGYQQSRFSPEKMDRKEPKKPLNNWKNSCAVLFNPISNSPLITATAAFMMKPLMFCQDIQKGVNRTPCPFIIRKRSAPKSKGGVSKSRGTGHQSLLGCLLSKKHVIPSPFMSLLSRLTQTKMNKKQIAQAAGFKSQSSTESRSRIPLLPDSL